MTSIQALNVKSLNTFGDLALHLIQMQKSSFQKLVQLLMSTTGTMKNKPYNLRTEHDEQGHFHHKKYVR
jgi:hypothetical protein